MGASPLRSMRATFNVDETICNLNGFHQQRHFHLHKFMPLPGPAQIRPPLFACTSSCKPHYHEFEIDHSSNYRNLAIPGTSGAKTLLRSIRSLSKMNYPRTMASWMIAVFVIMIAGSCNARSVDDGGAPRHLHQMPTGSSPAHSKGPHGHPAMEPHGRDLLRKLMGASGRPRPRTAWLSLCRNRNSYTECEPSPFVHTHARCKESAFSSIILCYGLSSIEGGLRSWSYCHQHAAAVVCIQADQRCSPVRFLFGNQVRLSGSSLNFHAHQNACNQALKWGMSLRTC